MKKLALIIAFLLFTSTAQAILIDNHDGSITQIRNDGSRLMWLQDANYAKTSGYSTDYIWNGQTFTNGEMPWNEAMVWADNLTFAGHSDWRLPNVLPIDGSENNYDRNLTYNGSSDVGYNITSLNSEMAYMFYVELGNLGYYDTNGIGPQTGWTLDTNTSLFSNLQTISGYWTNNDGYDANSNDFAWDFQFSLGSQRGQGITSPLYAWAVRSVTESNIIISPTSYDFGSINIGNTSTLQTFTISNTGGTDLTLGAISLTGADASEFNFLNDNCSAQIIPPSGTCTIDAVFTPTSEGAKSANLSIPSDDPDTPTLDVPLSGMEAPTDGVISGFVTNSSYIPIPSAKVKLRHKGLLIHETRTDVNGYYEFKGLADGKYVIISRKGGYTMGKKTGKVIQSKPWGTDEYINLVLE